MIVRFLKTMLLAALLCTGAARADTPITLFKSFAGNVNFTGTQKSLRTRSNSDNACSVSSTATLSLTGIPSGSTVLAAYLYWAASGSNGDFSILLDNKTVDAPSSRQYSSSTVGYNFYSGAADVTDIVKGNGTYVAGGLVPAQTGYCAVQAVLGGFQLLVIYSNSKETFRVLNVYEGFQYIQNSSVELTLANFTIPNPDTGLTGRVGHITWEGDDTLGNDGETLLFNGVAQFDAMNPKGNQFNSASNINNDYYSYGVDFDAFTVSPPTIAAGQKSAKTTYLSKSDLVLLNAEIIAAPNIPATDRGVTLTLDGPLVPSAATTYTVSVVNNGPMDEGGPLTVTGTLPAALIYGGASGKNWRCTAAGQVVTCTYTGTVTKNTTLPPLTLTVTPAASASGLVLFSVTVGGKLFDYYDGNDTSTVSARIGAANFTPVFIFTDKQCKHNKPFGDPGQPCLPLQLPFWPANRDIQTWITYVVKNVPTALASTNTTIPMRFALSCHDPRANAGVRATYDLRNGGTKLTLPLCASGGVIPEQNSSAWGTANNILYPGGSPTSQATTASQSSDPTDFLLRYQDVGRIELFVTDNLGRLGSTGAFVSRPDSLLVRAQADNLAGEPASPTDPRFLPAGTPFTMTVKAMMEGMTTPAPNFGQETDPARVKLSIFPATAADGAPIDAMAKDDPGIDSSGNPTLALRYENGLGAFSGGVATGTDFAFDDVGVIRVESQLANVDANGNGSYLGTGNVYANSINVGRFYPHHFDVTVTGPMTCVAPALCPTDPLPPAAPTVPATTITTMAYSGQPFAVKVEARNLLGKPLRFYQGELARDVVLSAVTAPNGSTAQTSRTSGLSNSTLSGTAVAAGLFNASVANSTSTYTFPTALAYKGSPATTATSALPVSVYLRATETSTGDSTTSKRSDAVEGGVRIVNGRVFVPNMAGNAALAMNVPVTAQFFGTRDGLDGWYDSTTDSTSIFVPASDVKFGSCTKVPGAATCSVPVKVDSKTVGAFSQGTGTVKLLAPGSGSSGSIPMYLSGPAWLPSVYGVLTYGTVKSPYVYLRELY
ncbi:hypothetical protein IP91_00511 [Pseudoduganella lurida]|uniref:Uncharacterized protein n=1 Tax=Pseudoduganella lurida TaxID=1036180 RepID=A0A562RKJ3_9BURK|nr:DUF6701 domain-containing protein [Pseudoduganella lurida]TWI69443.1 hypothetical protein IP91_00511 [Pseudoduganella lurida]